jgi:hypothetical protein
MDSFVRRRLRCILRKYQKKGAREKIAKTISNGQMPTLLAWDFSQYMKPTRADPDEEAIDWIDGAGEPQAVKLIC